MAERWASFDCYGTLIDWERGLADAYTALWPVLDRERALGHHHAVEPRIQLAAPELPYREVLARCSEAVAAIESVGLAAGGEAALADSLPSWRPFPEVPAALRELREAGWKLAILSNTDPDLLAASIEAIGVPVDLTVTAAEAGSYKPQPGHWQRFGAQAGIGEGRHVHVAASLYHDIEPAAALGIDAVWINRGGERSELPRLAELPDLTGLPETLAGLG